MDETGPREGDGANDGSSKFDVLRIYAAGLVGLLLLTISTLGLLGVIDHPAAPSSRPTGDAVILTEYDLLSRAGTIEPRAYWIGRRPGTERFELERDPEGNVYVRYLTGDDSTVTDDHTDALTVASYPVTEALQRLERAARTEGEALERREGFAVLGSRDSYSAYVVFEERPELQIEIYSPRRGEAVRLAGSGALTPLGWTPLA